MVRKEGLEPSRCYPQVPETCASTSSATFAGPARIAMASLGVKLLYPHTKHSMATKFGRATLHPLFAAGILGAFLLAAHALGAWTGFPVQDDTYMIRLLRLGGPDRVLLEHPDRPLYGHLLGMLTRIS